MYSDVKQLHACGASVGEIALFLSIFHDMSCDDAKYFARQMLRVIDG
jgi:hypothetical protein